MTEAIDHLLRVNETRLMGGMFCAYLAVSVLKNLAFMRTTYTIHDGLWPVWFVVRRRLAAPRIPPPLLPGLLVLFAVLLLAYAYTASRVYGLAALVVYLVTFPSILDMHLVHQKSNNCAIVLAILLISSEYHSPLIYAQSAAASTAWPLVCIRTLLAAIYVGTASHKLIKSGWKWTRGRALQWYLFEHYLWGDFKYAVPLMRRPLALRILSTITILTQLSAPVIIFGGWVPAMHGVFAFGFHISTQLFMGIYFLTFFGPAMVSSALSYPIAALAEAHLNLAGIADPLARLSESSPWQVALMALLPAIQIYSQFSWRIGFPFGPYTLFACDYSDFKNLAVLRLEVADVSGQYTPWQPYEYYDKRNLSHLGYDCDSRTIGLSPRFTARFKEFYWPLLQRETGRTQVELHSIRVVLRHAIWEGDIPAGYDDYMIATIDIDSDRAYELRDMSPVCLRSHRFATAGSDQLGQSTLASQQERGLPVSR
jgi:hypothetical protein